MKCVICHSESIFPKAVHEDICRGEDIIRVPIETLVCANCGERYYDRKTMQQLETTRRRIREETVPLKEIGKVLLCEN